MKSIGTAGLVLVVGAFLVGCSSADDTAPVQPPSQDPTQSQTPPSGVKKADDPPSGCPNPTASGVHYVGGSYENPALCGTINWDGCPKGASSYIPNECGCGCIDNPAQPKECSDHTDEASCVADTKCVAGYNGTCDCSCPGPAGYEAKGCEDCGSSCFGFAVCLGATPKAGCPSPTDPTVQYIRGSYENPAFCGTIDWDGCPKGASSYIPNECGCGCIDNPAQPKECSDHTDEASCVADTKCVAGYNGTCDCSCPGPAGYEAKGCEDCGSSCFGFAVCLGATPKAGCPSPTDPNAHYFRGSYENPSVCETIDAIGCNFTTQSAIPPQCGCGCIDTGE